MDKDLKKKWEDFSNGGTCPLCGSQVADLEKKIKRSIEMAEANRKALEQLAKQFGL